ncbi:MAG: hypothetical protein ABSF83_10965 [Nitrososphaerales archaeon]
MRVASHTATPASTQAATATTTAKAGTSFHFYISTNNVQATGVVPGLQQWESNQTDNAKFTFSPASVTDGSAQDKSPTAGNITTLYKISIPASLSAGMYTLTLYAQGSQMQPIVVQVTGASTTTSTTSSHDTTTTTTSTTSTTSSTTSSTQSTSSTTSTNRSTSTTSTTTTSASTKKSTSSSSTSGPLFAISLATNAEDYSATVPLVISGTVTPAPTAGTAVVLQVTNPDYTTVFYDNNVTLASDGSFSDTINIVANSSDWILGTYTVTVTSQEPAPMTAVTQFFYTPHVVSVTSTSSTVGTVTIFSTKTTTVGTMTTTTTQITTTTVGTVTSFKTTTVSGPALTTTTTTASGPTTTTTEPGSTVTTTTTASPSTLTTTASPSTLTSTLTSTATQISTSTVTQTNSVIPGWAYGLMAVLLVAGLAIGYVLKRPSAPRST